MIEYFSKTISKVIGYKFRDITLLEEALTHPSVNKRDATGRIISYERLEFLGDSVLNIVVTTMLFKLFPEEREGELARRKMDLVCGRTISDIAKRIRLYDFMIISNSESCNGGMMNMKNLENTLEALIGAVYMDSGYEEAKKFVLKYWEQLTREMRVPPQDHKTLLQEWTQKKKLPLPEYKVTDKSGPAHKPEFTISVYVEGYGEASARDNNKKITEQKAAESMLEKIVAANNRTSVQQRGVRDDR